MCKLLMGEDLRLWASRREQGVSSQGENCSFEARYRLTVTALLLLTPYFWFVNAPTTVQIGKWSEMDVTAATTISSLKLSYLKIIR